MISTLHYYDLAVKSYFSETEVDDGVIVRKIPCYFAIPNRNGVEIQTNDNTNPIMPFLCLTRTSITANTATHLVKGHVTRDARFKAMNSNMKNFDMIETMPYDFKYMLNIFSLQQEQFNQIVEQLLYKVEKQHYVPVRIDINNFNCIDNAYIGNISYSDNTTYESISDQSYRIFSSNLSFTVKGFIIHTKQSSKSILKKEFVTNIADDYVIAKYNGTVDDLIEKRERENLQ